MGFIDSYKHLEKICGEVLNDERKVSAYIDEMLNTPGGSYLVTGWDDDLKQLKHYRWVRNQIVHEPGCSENNMCEPNDVRWLDYFYSRIMNQTDPLALYHKATRTQPSNTSKKVVNQTQIYDRQPKSKKQPVGCATFVACIMLAVTVVVFILNYI